MKITFITSTQDDIKLKLVSNICTLLAMVVHGQQVIQYNTPPLTVKFSNKEKANILTAVNV
jgi:hypothetical protein